MCPFPWFVFRIRGLVRWHVLFATLPVGNRITDFISLGVIAKPFPVDKVHAISTSDRQNECPGSAIFRLTWWSIT